MNQEGLDQSSWKQIWVEALFIGFEGWEVGLLIFDKPLFRSLLWLISSPNSLICWLPASSQNLPSSGCYYTQSYWVLRRRFKGMSLVLCETARSSLTFGSSIASWNLWMLLEMSRFQITSSANTRNLCWASLALPDELKIDDMFLTLTCALRRRSTNTSIDWFNLALPACIKPSDLPAVKN